MSLREQLEALATARSRVLKAQLIESILTKYGIIETEWECDFNEIADSIGTCIR